MCDCIKVRIQLTTDTVSTDYQLEAGGTWDTENYWYFEHDGRDFYIFYNSSVTTWFVSDVLGDFSAADSRYVRATSCPLAGFSPTDPVLGWTNPNLIFTDFQTLPQDCPKCDQEDRTKKSFSSIKLPSDFVEQERGIKDCCCKYLVLASSGSDSFKNDVTSAWIKVSDLSDTYSFKLYKNGVLATYNPTTNTFPEQGDAFYTTIEWKDVLASDGIGCYELQIEYSISGITGTISWGQYTLKEYSIQNALGTARVKARFNSYQEIEDINFTGANVESTFRFFGFIGNRQPNTETDNIIYNNREMKSVIRENLNTYEIETEPTDECITRPLIELFLLSENELFISDYNAHNHSYRYEDIPVIVGESPKVEYYELSRKAKLTCTVEDKFKNKRTYY